MGKESYIYIYPIEEECGRNQITHIKVASPEMGDGDGQEAIVKTLCFFIYSSCLLWQHTWIPFMTFVIKNNV